MMTGVFHHHFKQELGGAFHDRVAFLEEPLVSAESVMLPQMLAKPGATNRPHPESCRVDGRRPSPEIDVVVSYPPAAAVVRSSCLGTRSRDVSKEVEQWLMAFGEITHFSRPVIHLRVNVDRVFAAPGWGNGVIPNPLEVGRLTAGAAAGDQ